MSVTEAMNSRTSCRAFLPTPVSLATVREILDIARQAPSGGNLQPWHVYVLAGAPLQELRARIRAKLPQQPRGEGSEYDIYPREMPELYKKRVFKCGEDMYATIKVAREDRPARLAQFARNYEFFGAPVGMFFALDRRMGPPQWSDLGMLIHSIMLLARERGLHTCAQESWSVWYRSVGEFLGFPPELMLFCGMALGIRDEAAPINTLRTERATLDDIASFRGF
ncbi:MAG: nitroreductase [Proteobacteria bacterium]|nr:nitroreductase [Pseudomonadota bacterium]